MAEPLLALDDVRAGYGSAIVLDGVSFALPERGSLAVLGRNGVGKSTLLLTIMGYTQVGRGRILWRGEDITRRPPHRRALAGIGWVAQEREIFVSLSVEENLTVAARAGRWNLEAVYDLFPRLAERRRNLGNQLSGGEQQMLAIARALMTNPALLLLDEPLEGLAPIVVEELAAAIRRMTSEGSNAFILVEQHADIALSLTQNAHRHRARPHRPQRRSARIARRPRRARPARRDCGSRRLDETFSAPAPRFHFAGRIKRRHLDRVSRGDPLQLSHSFAGIGMPDLRRAASVRPERSPGSRISSKPACRGSALRKPRARRRRAQNPRAAGRFRHRWRGSRCSACDVALFRAERAGLDRRRGKHARQHFEHQTEPRSLRAAERQQDFRRRGSVVGSPCAVSTVPGGSARRSPRLHDLAVRDGAGRHVENDRAVAARHRDRDRARSHAGDARAVIGHEGRPAPMMSAAQPRSAIHCA
jgi:branched-chain amino acid transport system ATP-binding protein